MTGLAASEIGVELLDDPAADPATVRSSLRHIARSNRWLGGRAAVRFALSRLLESVDHDRRLTLLDIGTGAGDLALDAIRVAARRGYRVAPLGLDRSAPAAALAREAGVPGVVGCAGSLPYADRSVDLVLVSQLLHHLSRSAALQVIAEASRVARAGVIAADLERSPVAVSGFWIASRLLRFDAATRADGITSVRRGYTLGEFTALLQAAGVPAVCCRRPGYRLVGFWKVDNGNG